MWHDMSIYKIIVPLQTRFRGRRMRRFAKLFGLESTMNVIDVGGRKFNWLLLDRTPPVTIVNIEYGDRKDGRFLYVRADGTKLPYADNSFDVCYSNSVIEHVGGWDKCVAFANEIRRVAPRYYVQTPNRRFFVEPHYIGAFIHWLPLSWQRRLVRWCSFWGLVDKPDQVAIDALLAEIRLLTVEQMKRLFPDAAILKERFLGFTKSIIAVRL
jgi:hypothetical protein